MVTSVDPSAVAALGALPPPHGAPAQDTAGARMFADLMKGVGEATSAGTGPAPSPSGSPGSATTDLVQQLSSLQDPADPIKSQYVMMDVLGQRMEFLGKMHVTVAVTSGFTGIFKQLFNRHD
ncbi:hypothetical protein [Rhizobacter sp. Root1221]|uniref:hypothetical protein n=1 Tax=Rhizobacter sp. Root1221 TaxID=1736433 RepID=UPI0006F42ACC|nr:hypothetical protein [Rhizobacter sp. Root1221]KQW02544.1 hypothetical protein ASC87_12530 [Rhizobacter sp. Root1221]